jgi:catechol 2,3-dioxygenase
VAIMLAHDDGVREDKLVKALKLGHLVLSVRDCVRSRDFYTQRLGMKVSSEKLERGQVFLTIGDEHHVLALFQRATLDPPTPDQPGIRHIAFQLDDFDQLQSAYDELTAAGVAVENVSEDGITRSFYLRDPDNNCIELFCNRVDNGLEAIRTADLSAQPLDMAAAGARQH